jgi:hypothetical protein
MIVHKHGNFTFSFYLYAISALEEHVSAYWGIPDRDLDISKFCNPGVFCDIEISKLKIHRIFTYLLRILVIF